MQFKLKQMCLNIAACLMLLSCIREDTYPAIVTTILQVLLNTLTQGYAVLSDTPVLNHVAILTAGVGGGE